MLVLSQSDLDLRQLGSAAFYSLIIQSVFQHQKLDSLIFWCARCGSSSLCCEAEAGSESGPLVPSPIWITVLSLFSPVSLCRLAEWPHTRTGTDTERREPQTHHWLLENKDFLLLLVRSINLMTTRDEQR